MRSAYTLVVLTLWPMSLCILHADDTRKGGWSAQASSGPSSADCTAVVTVAIGTYLHFCGNINIEIQQAVGWKPMPLHFLLRPAKTPSASLLPPPPDAAADRLHTSTVDPLRLVRLTPRDSSFPSKHNLPRRDTNATPQHRALVFAAPPTHPHLVNNPVL